MSNRTTPKNTINVAIVGAGVRLPKSDSVNAFWDKLKVGESLISEVNNKRWSKEELYGDPKTEGDKTSSYWGGFVDDIDCFDANFFGISPRESKFMDPQQRIAMEMAWHAFEDAGIPPSRIKGTNTGVFMGVCHWDYAELLASAQVPVDPYFPTGTAYSVLANRISYFFDLKGPSISVDTACSSSLVSLALAVNAIKSGECELALAGGVNLIWSPQHFIAFSKNGMLSKDGKSYAFDDRANGYVRGEGGGVVLLKALDKAIEDGDNIYAVIRGVASNHGGKTGSLTVTNPQAQADLIASLYHNSGIDPRDVGYIETHGTGTPLGDPIEVLGLKKAFERLSDATETAEVDLNYCGLGSVKTNIGHLEGAAGIAGIIKILAALHYKELPKNLNFNRLNPKIDLSHSPFYIVDQHQAWQHHRPSGRIAGISSFGFGGSNAHAILQEFVADQFVADSGLSRQSVPMVSQPQSAETIASHFVAVPLSAKSMGSLIGYAQNLLDFLDQNEELNSHNLVDIAYSLQCGRDALIERVCFVVTSINGLKTALRSYIEQGSPDDHTFSGNTYDKTGKALRTEIKDNQASLFESWVKHDDIHEIVKHWVWGVNVLWDALYRTATKKPQKIRLPLYVFEKKRHWFPVNSDTSVKTPQKQDQFALVLSGNDFFLKDHTVGRQSVLPGVYYLELVLSAIQYRQNSRIDFLNVFWLSPFAIALAEDDVEIRKSFTLALENQRGTADTLTDPASMPAHTDFRFYAGGNHEHQSMLYARGSYVYHNPIQSVALSGAGDCITLPDLSGLKEIDRQQCYQALQSTGINHGPRLQGVEHIYIDSDVVWVKIATQQDDKAFVIHPTILDAALQAGIATALLNHPTPDPYVPFSLDQLSVHLPCPMTVWARLSEQNRFGGNKDTLTFDLDIFTEQGELVISASNFTMRLLRGKGHHMKDNNGLDDSDKGLLYFKKSWIFDDVHRLDDRQQEDIGRHDFENQDNHILAFYAKNHSQDEAWVAGFRDQLVASISCRFQSFGLSFSEEEHADIITEAYSHVFSYIKQRLQDKPRVNQRIIVCAPSTVPEPIQAVITALLRVAQNENPRIRGQFVSLETSGAVGAETVITNELHRSENVFSVKYNGQGLCRREHFTAHEFLPDEAPIPFFSESPVFWITGGLGGIGQLISAQLAADFPGCTLYLTGRKSAVVQREVLSVLHRDTASLGCHIEYFSMDITDTTEIEKFVALIQDRHDGIDAIFHAAGQISDNYILKKTVESSLPVLSSKIAGTIAIDQATRQMQIGRLILFSSVASVFGNIGQSDYAAANAFLDAFAASRNQRVRNGLCSGETIAVNWPLWENGGMAMDATTRASVRQESGMEPLPTEQAMDTLRHVLRDTRESQILVTFGDREKINTYLESRQQTMSNQRVVSPHRDLRENIDSSIEGTTVDDERLFEYARDYLKAILSDVIERDAETIRGDQKIEEYGFDSIMAMEMLLQLERSFSQLSKTLFFEYVTINEVAEYLVDAYREKLSQLYNHATVGSAVPAKHVTSADRSQEAQDNPVPRGASLELPEQTVASPYHGTDQSGDDRHDVAIIGLSGRYPKAKNMDELWDLLQRGEHAFESIPVDRWNHDAIYYPERDVLGKSTIMTGGFLDDIDKFDPRYFQISQREAEKMSPEVRLFLEVGVEALEDSGYSKESIQQLYQGDVGVVAGTMSNHYNLYGFQNNLVRGSSASGSYTGTIPNMLSYFYGFTGPSLFVDTMCSASSTCIHVAVQMLRSGECNMVVAGGMNLLLHPYNLISSSQEHFTTKTSEIIRSYGIGADGTILGEGVGAVVLKTLADAKRDGDNIWGVIKGTALSNAGIRNGFTVPQPQMQGLAIEKALEDAAIDPQTIGYFEGHGSGTELGDPVEIKGATQAFQKYTKDKQFCPIGSVKSNVAHLLAAAGVAGISKILLQFKHQQIVPSLGADTLNHNIRFDDSPFYVQRELQAWEPVLDDNHHVLPRRASITSIGAGGMNSHMILEEFIETNEVAKNHPEAQQLFVFSATTPDALVRNLRHFVDYLSDNRRVSLESLAYTLQVAKNQLKCRLAFCATTVSEVLTALENWLKDQPVSPLVYFIKNVSDSTQEFSKRTVKQAVDAGVLEDLAVYWTNGAQVDWFALHRIHSNGIHLSDAPLRKIRIPAYQFEKKRCWFEVFDDAPSVIEPLGNRQKYHPLLSENVSDLSGIRFTSQLREAEVLDYIYSVRKTPHVMTMSLLDAAIAFMSLADKAERYLPMQWVLFAPISALPVQLLYEIAQNEKTEQFSDVYLSSRVHEDSDYQVCARIGFETSIHSEQKRVENNAKLSLGSDRFDSISGETVTQVLEKHKVIFGSYSNTISELQQFSPLEYCVILQDADYQHNHFAQHTTLPVNLSPALQQVIMYVALQQGFEHWQDYDICEASIHLHPQDISRVSCFHLMFELFHETLSGKISFVDSNDEIVGVFDQIVIANVQHRDRERKEAHEIKQSMAAHFKIAHTASRISSEPVPTPTFDAESPSQGVPASKYANSIDLLSAIIRPIVADLLKFDEDEVGIRTHFYEFGFDSIGLTRLCKEINEALATNMTPAIFFDCEHIEALCLYLAEQGVRVGSNDPVGASALKKNTAQINVAPYPLESHIDPDETHARNQHEPIAVIGMAGRFPEADSVDELWSNLLDQKDCIRDFPYHRYNPNTQDEIAGFSCVRQGGYLDKVDGFDAAFFNISRTEAEFMDPQQRQVLEVVWHAIENAAYDPSQLPEDSGVFLGVSNSDYRALLRRNEAVDGYMATGNSHAMLANRISFFLDIHGPSEAIDTACSSSLVAIHQACESLRTGASSVAIAGGVNLLLDIQGFAEPDHAGMLSPDGRCNTFSDHANGYVRGEGVGIVILKPLSSAQAAGDNILAVIENSAHQHGGRAKSLTAPNTKRQAELLRTVFRGIDINQLQYIETHGTGTEIGDPVEIDALKQVLTDKIGSPVYLGALKSNIGHLESAAGVASLIKTINVLREKRVPANIHCSPQNPYIDLEQSRLVIPERTTILNEPEQAIFAAVNSFGFGGSVASVVLRHYDNNLGTPRSHRIFSAHATILVLSAKTKHALVSQAINLKEYLSLHLPSIENVAYTLQVGRAALPFRSAFAVVDIADALKKLTLLIENYGRKNHRPIDEAALSEKTNVLSTTSIYTGHIRDSQSGTISDEAVLEMLRKDNAHLFAEGFVKGTNFHWTALYGRDVPQRLALPGYPFEHQRYWLPKDQFTTWREVSALENEQTAEHSFYEQLLDQMLQEDIDTETVLSLLEEN